jgi:3-keto-disaccharide hydrolase
MNSAHFRFLTAMAVLALAATGVAADKKPAKTAQAEKWISLFDGKTLKGWTKTKFGGEGTVEVKNGRLILGYGSNITGVHTKRKLPKMNYEVQLEAMRVDGSDFFCGLTFPVGKKHLSLIIGGWGGGVCGISSIDGNDASENETTTYRGFKKKKWYPVRLRVTDTKVEAWLEGKRIVDVKTKGKKLSLRAEVEPSKPFGFATWQTTGALRKIRIRELPAAKPQAKK